MNMYRQGDVLIVRIDEHELPEELQLCASQVIVEGEVTGHAHRLAEGRILRDAQNRVFLECLVATQVVHEEHQAIRLEPGYYQVIRQREYSPEAIRLVVD